jgi:hypothetical protein
MNLFFIDFSLLIGDSDRKDDNLSYSPAALETIVYTYPGIIDRLSLTISEILS